MYRLIKLLFSEPIANARENALGLIMAIGVLGVWATIILAAT